MNDIKARIHEADESVNLEIGSDFSHLLMPLPHKQQQLRDIAATAYQKAMEQREEILTAFIAKYGCQPDEMEQVELRHKDGGIIWCVRKRCSTMEGRITRSEKEIREKLEEAKKDLDRTIDDEYNDMGLDFLYRGRIEAYNFALGGEEECDE